MKTPLVALVAYLLLSSPVLAEPVSVELSPRLVGVGDYLPGDTDKPTVLMLHGFLQSHGFHTIHTLAAALNDEGYTVLSPTLSLGITRRKRSLACEAVHAHTVQDDIAELGSWMDWLQRHGHDQVVLIGHSTGSLELLAYLAQTRDPRVVKLIGISIVEGAMELEQAQQTRLREMLRERVAAGDRRLVKHQFSFCKPLTATPDGLLSYLEWTPPRILLAIQDAPIPVLSVVGSRDQRLGKDWVEQLERTGQPVLVIDGANHFMDGEYEFALLDVVLDELP